MQPEDEHGHIVHLLPDSVAQLTVFMFAAFMLTAFL